MKKAKPGTVGIEEYRGKYRLQLPRMIANGSSRYISTGLDTHNPGSIKQVQRLAWDIEDAIAADKFCIDDYRASKSQPKKQITLSELWQLFSEHRKTDLAVSTYHKAYQGKWKRLIASVPYENPNDAEKIKDWIVQHRGASSARQILILLNAASNWAVSQGLLKTNRFTGLSKGIKRPKRKPIDAFSTSEMLAILDAFRGDHYETFVNFLFITGCRTGEAIALQWKQIAPDYRSVTINASYYLGLDTRKPTKTGETRSVPCNPQLIRLLKGLTRGAQTDQVFTSVSGGIINNNRFLSDYWKPKINQLIEQRLVERYRPAYNTRHTAITRMLESGLTAAEVARVVGNSPRVINDHYAGVSRNIVLPEI
ncbi:site-specific integrase [Nostoc punctiforme]|uniref:Phage integrase family protein n=1 Tax=Nostoc punctiforme (strain ATCC 29133 / PCC 73102) TaxID=63737 RepID=B2IT48_NOSP7|nr:site-specific integrase [Nostoc punctiforme]ACC79546.1 phage integrase family protein [Nostoc punctiforme PCC 73102]